MAQQEVIKEFLVSLGFKKDDSAIKRFTKDLDTATKAVETLVKRIAEATLAVGAGVAIFASNLEDLYFASRRVGSSATNIKAFDYAASRLGATVNESRGALEGLAKFLRENPGGEQWLQSLGIQTRDENGELLETTKILENLGTTFKKLPWFQSRNISDQIGGISDNVLRALQNDQFGKLFDEQQMRGADNALNAATESAHQFENQMAKLGQQSYMFGVQLEGALMTHIGPQLEKLSTWIYQHGGELAEDIATWVEKAVDFGIQALPYIEKFIEYLVQLDHDTDGLSTKILAILAAAKLLGAGSVITGVLSLAGAFTSLGTAVSTVGVALAGLAGYKAGSWLADKIDKFIAEQTGNPDATLGGYIYDMTHSNNPGGAIGDNIMAFFKGKGFTTAQASGLLANIMRESGGRTSAVGDNGQAYGLLQWHPDRQEAFKKWSGRDIRDSNMLDQLNFIAYELSDGAERKAGLLLSAAENARQAGEIVSRAYVRPKDQAGEAAARGDLAVQIDQSTQIIVQGENNPAATAAKVAGQQDGVNKGIVRNMQTVIK